MNETSHSEATLSIEDILLTLRKHLKIIIGSTIIVTLLAFVFASDAHNLRGRNFRMAKGVHQAHNGPEMVAWMQDNAKKIINGDDLEPSEYHHIKEKKKKFWLFR